MENFSLILIFLNNFVLPLLKLSYGDYRIAFVLVFLLLLDIFTK